MAYPIQTGRRLAVLLLLAAVVARANAGGSAMLTDADVDAILEGGSAGVFYAWSPHMPLSVDGLAEIIAAGERLGIVVVPVLSPHANVDYARDRIDGRDLPEAVLRLGRSAELIRRDLFVHAPAILIFKDGDFVSPVLPGLRRTGDYASLIGRFLGSAEE